MRHGVVQRPEPGENGQVQDHTDDGKKNDFGDYHGPGQIELNLQTVIVIR
jgi:hypothetical protein